LRLPDGAVKQGALSCVIFGNVRRSWRRVRDSNPRSACALAGFQDQCNQPLCQLSDSAATLKRL
jgi:hypothetical protein